MEKVLPKKEFSVKDRATIFLKDPKSPEAESFRALRTNILHSKEHEHLRVILVTSSHPDEGKTNISCNLALAMAETNKRVLLIDADIRRPSMHKAFGLKKETGLTDVVRKKITFDQAIKPSGTNNLSLITSGEVLPNPSEIIGGNGMEEFIANARAKFDFIILDSPGILPVTDSTLLSPLCDGVLFAIRAEKTPREAVKRSQDLLKNVNSEIIGVVLNGIDPDRSQAYYYYRY